MSLGWLFVGLVLAWFAMLGLCVLIDWPLEDPDTSPLLT